MYMSPQAWENKAKKYWNYTKMKGSCPAKEIINKKAIY